MFSKNDRDEKSLLANNNQDMKLPVNQRLMPNRYLLLIIFALLIFIYSSFVRLQGLGYSNFQGDEINTITFLQSKDTNFLTYLLEQKKARCNTLLIWPIFRYLATIMNLGSVCRTPFLEFLELSCLVIWQPKFLIDRLV